MWWRLFGLDLTKMPVLIPLWYVRCLLILVLMSPLLKFLVRKFGLLWLVISSVLMMTAGFYGSATITAILDKSISLRGIFYFSVGMYIQDHTFEIKSKRILVWCALVGGMLLLCSVYFRVTNLNLDSCLLRAAIPFLMYAVWSVMPDRAWPRWLTSCAFPMYITHIIFIHVFYTVSKLMLLGHGLRDVLAFCIGVVSPIVMLAILRSVSPKCARILFAGRV